MSNYTKHPSNLVYNMAAKAVKKHAQDIHLLAGTLLYCTTLPRVPPSPSSPPKNCLARP